MAKNSLRKKLIKTFIVGLMVFVLIILAGIITGVSLLPAALVAYVVGGAGATMVLSALGVVVGIYFLGFVFERFKVNRKK